MHCSKFSTKWNWSKPWYNLFSVWQPVLNTLSLAAVDASTHETWRATVYSFGRTDLLPSQNWIMSQCVFVSEAVDIIRISYYIYGPELIKLTFVVLYVSWTMGLTGPYKSEDFLHYATTLTQALLQVFASYSMQCVFHIPTSQFPFSCNSFPFPSHRWSYSHSHGNAMRPMGSQSFPFPCTSLLG